MTSLRFVHRVGTDSHPSRVMCSSIEPADTPDLRPIATFPTFVINLERDFERPGT